MIYTNTETIIHTYTHTHTYIYIYICLHVCVCVSISMCVMTFRFTNVYKHQRLHVAHHKLFWTYNNYIFWSVYVFHAKIIILIIRVTEKPNRCHILVKKLFLIHKNLFINRWKHAFEVAEVNYFLLFNFKGFLSR